MLGNIKVNVVFVSSSGYTNAVTKIVDSLRRITSSSHTVDR